MAKVDIAVPCYNYGRFLPDCVHSILSQGIEDVRIRIIDNASTDGSADIARALAEEDRRISVSAHAHNRGPHASFNEGIDWADADYFMVLCSDDLMAPGGLASMIAVLDANPDVAFAYGHEMEWFADAPFPASITTPDSATWRVRDGRTFIYERCRYPDRHLAYGMILTRTWAQKKAGYYNRQLAHSDDFEMLLRLACLGRVAGTYEYVGIRRMHTANRSHDFIGARSGHIVERLEAFDSFFAIEGRTLPRAPHLARIARSSLAGQAYWRGMKDLVRGRGSALDLLSTAVRLEPVVAVVPPLGYLSRMRRSFFGALKN